jgi:hypothetical protein
VEYAARASSGGPAIAAKADRLALSLFETGRHVAGDRRPRPDHRRRESARPASAAPARPLDGIKKSTRRVAHDALIRTDGIRLLVLAANASVRPSVGAAMSP